MRNKAEELGLDMSVLKTVTQAGCEYTPTCELTDGKASWCSDDSSSRSARSQRQRSRLRRPRSA